jgi:hypothetical protein
MALRKNFAMIKIMQNAKYDRKTHTIMVWVSDCRQSGPESVALKTIFLFRECFIDNKG